LRLRLVPRLGDRRMAEITRPELQCLVSRWLDSGLSPSKVRAIVNAARVLFRDFDLLPGRESQQIIDPTPGLRLPADGRPRERIATPAEARCLIGALGQRDRAVWATAMYAGLRYGELRALQVRDVDLERRRIYVQRGCSLGDHHAPIEGSAGEAPSEDRARRGRPHLRRDRKAAIQRLHDQCTSPGGLGCSWRGADRPSEMPPYRGLADARCGCPDRQGRQVHRSRLHRDHSRSLRASSPSRRRGSHRASRPLSPPRFLPAREQVTGACSARDAGHRRWIVAAPIL
jgi:hypothetical protein